MWLSTSTGRETSLYWMRTFVITGSSKNYIELLKVGLSIMIADVFIIDIIQ